MRGTDTTTTATQPLRAFRGDPALKTALLVEIGKHEAADAITKGLYGETDLSLEDGFKGCAIGCALHSLNALNGAWCPTPKPTNDHARFPTELGIPIELAYLIDYIFENLPDAESQTWPRRVIEAIQPGQNLDGVVPALLQWMILDPTDGLIANAELRFHTTYQQFARLVAQDWAAPGSVTLAKWDAVDQLLAECAVWARVRAWAWAGARTWTRARAWAWAGARARAWARAWTRAWTRARTRARATARATAGAWTRAGAYSRLSDKILQLIVEMY